MSERNEPTGTREPLGRSRLVDPHICPDCRAGLDAAATCTACGLRLTGPLAAELWQQMQRADRLVEQLRSAAGERAQPAAPSVASPSGLTAGLPAAPAAGPLPDRTRRATSGLPGTSVPVVLLALGALCLLVAAVVFVAVAWGSLGLAAKTTILLAVTALFTAAAVAVTRRGLRFAAETLWVVVAGLVAVDLAAAYGADLLGLARVGDRSAVALVGATELGLAVAAGAWATLTPLRRVHGLVAVAGIGTVLLAGAEAWTAERTLTLALSVPVLAILALAIDRATDGHLRRTAAVVGGAALISWFLLVGRGLDRMAATSTDRAWWAELIGWPLLAAAALAAVPAVLPTRGRTLPKVDQWARAACAGGSLLTLALFVVGPSTGPTPDLLSWAVVTVLLATVSAVAPRTWAWPAAALSALGLVLWALLTLVRPLEVITRVPAADGVRPDRLDMRLPEALGGPAPWTAVVSALVVGVAAAGVLRHLPSAATRETAGRVLVVLGPGALALGATTGLLETRPTVLVAVLAWAGTLALSGALAVTARHHDGTLAASLLLAGYVAVAGLRLAAASHLLAALLGTVVAVALAVAYARAASTQLRGGLLPGLAACALLAAAYAATHWPYLAGGQDDAVGLGLAGGDAAALLLARAAGRGAQSRVAIEATAFVVGLAATLFPTDAATTAMVLTVVGSAVAAVAVLHRDRDQAAWIGVVLLGCATVIRVADEVRTPELYTLPAAALLVGAGWWRLTADPAVGSARALSSGLALALVPSLLLALDEPVSVRGACVGAAGVLALAVGVLRLWAAPFVAGAATTGVLAVRHLGPVVDGLPRWVSLGSVGLALLLVGVTWEQRRRDVATAERYLTSLR